MKDTYEPIEALFANDAESLIGHRYMYFRKLFE